MTALRDEFDCKEQGNSKEYLYKPLKCNAVDREGWIL